MQAYSIVNKDYFPEILRAVELVKHIHAGQTDKGGVEYWKHLVATMLLLPEDASLEMSLTALFHDSLEDSSRSFEKVVLFLEGKPYSQAVLGAIYVLTRRDYEKYHEYISRIIDSGNEIALRVKLADNLHNSFPGRIENSELVESLQSRYAVVRVRLSTALAAIGIVPVTHADLNIDLEQLNRAVEMYDKVFVLHTEKTKFPSIIGPTDIWIWLVVALSGIVTSTILGIGLAIRITLFALLLFAAVKIAFWTMDKDKSNFS